MTNMFDHSYDVIICGAGPTGLVLALTLTLCDKPTKVLLLNKRLHRGTHSRAFVVWPRNIESLYRLSPKLFNQMQSSTRLSPRVQVAFGVNVTTGCQLTDATNPDKLSLARTPWFMPQYTTESVLEQFLLEHLPPQSMYAPGWRLASCQTSLSGVTVLIVKDESGEQHTVSCKYLIGCDGVRSAVRDMASIEEIKRPGVFHGWLADIRFQRSCTKPEAQESTLLRTASRVDRTARPTWEDKVLNNITLLVPRTKGWMAVAPIDDSVHRVMIPRPPPVSSTPILTKTYGVYDFGAELDAVADQARNSIGAQIEGYIRDTVSEYGLSVKEVVIATDFPFTFGIAQSYYKDNIVLAGDAAHHHSAAGGQGMNLGMQDAFDLGWRLQLLVKFHSSDGVSLLQKRLFHSYEAERRSLAQSVVEWTHRLSRRLLKEDGKEERLPLLALWVPELFSVLMFIQYYIICALMFVLYPIVIPKVIRWGMQLHFNYCESPITKSDTSAWWSRGIKAGVSLTSSSVIVDSDHPTARCVAELTSGRIVAELTSLFVFKSFCLIYFPSQAVLGAHCVDETNSSLRQVDPEWSHFMTACDTRIVSQIVVVCKDSSSVKSVKDGPLCVQYVQDVDSRAKYTGGSSKSILFVIRPDGFVGYKGEPFQSRLVVQYLSQFVPIV